MIDLPLFPLNTVLFPGMPLELHIFEPRYCEMINHCIDAQTPFGVVLIQRGEEALGSLAEPHKVGCRAHIVQIQRLPVGRMDITVVGQERFRVLNLDYASKSYLVGRVEDYPLNIDMSPDLKKSVIRLRLLIRRYMDKLASAANTQFSPQKLPADARALSYLASILLQIPNTDKQDLLSYADALELLKCAGHIYRRELALLDILLEKPLDLEDATFSPN